jgi:hypothetical protein
LGSKSPWAKHYAPTYPIAKLYLLQHTIAAPKTVNFPAVTWSASFDCRAVCPVMSISIPARVSQSDFFRAPFNCFTTDSIPSPCFPVAC